MSSPTSDNPFQSPTSEHDLIAPLGDAIVAEGTFTQRDLHATYRAMVYNLRTLLLLVGVSMIFFSVTFGRIVGDYWLLGVVGYPLCCFLPLGALLEARFYYQSYWRSQYQKLGAEPEQQRISLDEQGVHFESEKVKSSLPWSRFASLKVKRRMLVLVLRPFGWISLPSHFFESRDAFVAAKQLIQQNLGRRGSPSSAQAPTDDEVIDAAIPGAVAGVGTLTRRELYYCSWRLVRFNALISASICIGLVGIAFYYGLAGLVTNRFEQLPIAMMPLVIAALISVRWVRYVLGVRRTYREVTQHTQVRWSITDEKLNASSRTFSLRLKWDEFDKVVINDKMLLLIYKKIQAFSLPRRFFASDDDWRQVIEWAQQSQQRN